MSEENKNEVQNFENDENEAQNFENNKNEAQNFENDENEAQKSEEMIQTSEENDSTDKPKKKIKIALKAYLLSTVAIVLAAVMLTYTICSAAYKSKYAPSYLNNSGSDAAQTPQTAYTDTDAIDLLLKTYFYGDASIDKEKLNEFSLKLYLASLGDPYAYYYTQEEIEATQQSGSGKSEGIGINIISTTINVNGAELSAVKIINVTENTPAAEAGLKVNDLIVFVGTGDSRELVDTLGYENALAKLQGASGTFAEFTAWRWNESKNAYDEKEYKLERREIETVSIYFRKYALDATVGIVKINKFDLSTPKEFKEAIEKLKNDGCEKFVLDVRYNPGGYLPSIAAILSYFLDEGDVYIRIEDKNGEVEEKRVEPVVNYKGNYESCNVSKEEIGQYKNLNMVVLCNQSTASAAELFTATFRDYNLGAIVGANTYGKGKMQTTYSLSYFGLEGAVKFTTHMYYSAKSDSYDGIGIKPDEGCEIELSEEAKKYNTYELPDGLDNQLAEAVKHFK